MKPNYKRPFNLFVKKAHKPLQLAIEDAVEEICVDPELGEVKSGDLAGIRGFKFRFNRQEYLVAYRSPSRKERAGKEGIEFLVIDFYLVGPYENFYDTLKRYLKEE